MLPHQWTPSQYNGLVGSLGKLIRVPSSDIYCQFEESPNIFSFDYLLEEFIEPPESWHTNGFDLLELKDGLKVNSKYGCSRCLFSVLLWTPPLSGIWCGTVYTVCCQSVKLIWTSPLITLFDQLPIWLGLQTL